MHTPSTSDRYALPHRSASGQARTLTAAARLRQGDQFSAEFVRANPNSKIPALVDRDGPDGEEITVFESASILLYLGEKFGRFVPTDPREKQEMYNWLFWQMAGQGPMTGNFGHFMVYAPEDQVGARDYGVMRYGVCVSVNVL